jgi:hypothetical protein
MPDDTESAGLRARLEAIVKKAEHAEAQAATTRPDRPPPPRGGVQGHRLEADGYNCSSACAIFVFIVVFPTAASQLIPTASSTNEDTIVTGLHLQAAAVLNVRQLVNIVLDSYSTNYAS